jgi:hypothetical protein
MRLLNALAVVALLGSAYFGSRHYMGRRTALPLEHFVTADPAERAREGDAARSLGVAFGGYEDMVARAPHDLAALRHRIRAGLMIGAVGFDPRSKPLVQAQIDAYLARRGEIDPDGSFLKGVVEPWVHERIRLPWDHQAAAYARTSSSLYLAARGDAAGLEAVAGIAQRGRPSAPECFAYVRGYHPRWPGVEPLVLHYLQSGALEDRVEAGLTLLDYHGLFGVGGDMVDRFLPAILEAVREMRARLRGSVIDAAAATSGRAAIAIMALLANRGNEDERRLLEQATPERDLRLYVPFGHTIQIARLCAGFGNFASLGPLSMEHRELDHADQELYYIAAAHRAAFLARSGGGDTGELAGLLDIVESAYEGARFPSRVFAMQALLRLAPERGAVLVERAIRGRSGLMIHAGALREDVEDRIATFLPALAAREPDLSSLGAVCLLDRGAAQALQK